MKKFFSLVTFALLALGGCQTGYTPTVQHSQAGTTASFQTGFGLETGRERTREFYRDLNEKTGYHTQTTRFKGRLGGDGPPARGVVRTTTSTVYEQGDRTQPQILGPIAEFFGLKPRNPE